MNMWAYHHGARIDFLRRGTAPDNAFIETFNGTLRDECLTKPGGAIITRVALT
jgi:putative transposase